MRALVVDVKRLSIHDGPGIRTTVFLKGCPLRCHWCHNPESVSPKPEVGFHAGKCAGCGRCVEACPVHAHALRDGKHLFDRSPCTACGKCVDACLPGALELFGHAMTPEETARAVLEDLTFYRKSGGGCTVSGGEPLLQAGFCADLLRILGKEGVHRAVDTCGAVPWTSFQTVLPHTDLFLFDLKHVDRERHREQVGIFHGEILENLKALAESGVPIEIRIPVIPGFNLDGESMSAAGSFLRGLDHIVGVRLLPYHLARSKYEAVGRVDTMPRAEPPSQGQMEEAAACLRGFGIAVL